MEEHAIRTRASQDTLVTKLQGISHWILIVIFGLLPLLFVPVPAVLLGYTKTAVVIFGAAAALIFLSLSVLRSGKLSFSVSYALAAFWGVVLITGVSALLSGDIRDAIIGDTLDIHTTAFVLLLAAVATIWTLINISKKSVMRLYMLIILSTLVLAVYHILRLLFGFEFLSFGIFGSATATPIGGWNDLALFFSLAVLISLVTLEQLPLKGTGKALFGAVIGAGLIMLAAINFFFVWVVLALVSLVMVVYSLGKDRFIQNAEAERSKDKPQSMAAVVAAVVVFVVSILFILGGPALSQTMSNITGVSYVEVRPSFEATADIAQGVYTENAFLGTGPNRFADAWREHKNPTINTTAFWNTSFQSGSGYIPTFFVTTGVLGGIAWLLFFVLLVVSGVRMVFRSGDHDTVWYFIGTSSFVGAVFIWGMSFVYVPGNVILLLGALCTGLMFVAQGALNPKQLRTLTLARNRQTGFMLTLAIIVIIAASVGAMYVSGRQYVAAYLFADSGQIPQLEENLGEIEGKLLQAFELTQNDLFVRRLAEYQIALINLLISQPAAEDTQQRFQQAVQQGRIAAQLATETDATNPENWGALGRLYGALVPLQVEGSYTFAKEALERARDLDPKNPLWLLLLAQLEAQSQNIDAAYQNIREAITLKPNYSDAIFFLSQLDIAQGNVQAAIDATRAIISIEPQNPARYYQLGVLEAAQQNHEVAIAAFEEAVRLNTSYSNARYFLALSYAAVGRANDAEAQLQRVLELNPGNELVLGLLQELETTGTISLGGGESDQLVEEDEVEVPEATDDDVTTDTAPDTPLVSPVNVPNEEESAVDEAEADTSADGDSEEE